MLRGAGGTRSSPGQGEHRAGGLPTSPRGSGAWPSPALPTRGHPRPSLRIAAAAGASRFRDGAPGQGSIPSAGVGDKGPRETSGFSRHFSQPKRPNGSFNRKKSHPVRIGAQVAAPRSSRGFAAELGIKRICLKSQPCAFITRETA